MTNNNLGLLLKNMVKESVNEIYTAAPAIVTNVYLPKYQCDVQLKYKIAGQEIKMYNIPIATLTNGGSAIMMAPKIGDPVIVLFTKHGLRECLTNDEVKDKISEKVTFRLDNAVVIAGLFTKTRPVPNINAEEILIYHKDTSEVRFRQGGKIEVTSPTEIRLKAPKVFVETDRFEVI